MLSLLIYSGESMLETLPKTDVEYPESDSLPMAETDTHRIQMTDALIHPLKERYRDQGNVYVSGNLFLYYEEGNPKAFVAPDVFVVFGVSNAQRRTYKLWEEGQAPDVVFELTSKKTYQDDLSRKRLLYEELGVREYFLFDPLHEYLRPPLQGFRLTEDAYYEPLIPESVGSEWEIDSIVLRLTLRTDGTHLRLYDPETKDYLRTPAEAEAALRSAEAEIERLKMLLKQGK
jgi:Uma2 family endonuclease